MSVTGASSASAVTDSQGCAFLLKVTPGKYTVAVSRSSYVDQDQQPKAAATVSVAAGATVTTQFQYDAKATFVTRYVPDYDLPAPVRTIPMLPVTFVNPYATTVMVPTSMTTEMRRSFDLHPFASGYSVYAGACRAASPQAWGADPPAPVGAAGGGSVDVAIPMGVVLVSVPAGAAREMSAIPVTSSVPGDPGCGNLPSNTYYSFGTAAGYTVAGGSVVAVALPYGSWQLRLGGQTVNSSQITLLGIPARTTFDPKNNFVTFDPRP